MYLYYQLKVRLSTTSSYLFFFELYQNTTICWFALTDHLPPIHILTLQTLSLTLASFTIIKATFKHFWVYPAWNCSFQQLSCCGNCIVLSTFFYIFLQFVCSDEVTKVRLAMYIEGMSSFRTQTMVSCFVCDIGGFDDFRIFNLMCTFNNIGKIHD